MSSIPLKNYKNKNRPRIYIYIYIYMWVKKFDKKIIESN
jgi:hypothetical protein